MEKKIMDPKDYRSRSDTNQQLARADEASFKFKYDKKPLEVSPIEMKPYVYYPDVPTKRVSNMIFESDNVVSSDLARECFNFLSMIPYYSEMPELNNTDRQPLTNMYTNDQSTLIWDKNKDNGPEFWKYERYAYGMFRLCPTSYNAYYNSPVSELIHVLHQKWKKTIWRDGFGIIDPGNDPTLFPSTWVIQRVPKGKYIGSHTDSHSDKYYERVLSFNYYLVPEDYGPTDGGVLYFERSNYRGYFRPRMNSMISWRLSYSHPVPHYTDLLNSDDPRFTVTGFFSRLLPDTLA